jgi:transcriptional regulator with XRE-family HTH domain
MGTLGKYLRSAREERGIELREAAQQTRISLQYLKALEEEDFSKLPGAVFVKGFLKNYSKFLKLDEAEVMNKFAESQQTPPHVTATQASQGASQPIAEEAEKSTSAKFPLEPFVWGTVIIIVLVIALFAALPRHQREMPRPAAPGSMAPAQSGEPLKPEKLYLEVIALEDTWLLVRTDASPQKKAILAKGESLIWSADERFLLSYSNAGALRLLLNGKELAVDEPKSTVIRDLMITASGITNRRVQRENVRPITRKQQPAPASVQSVPTPSAGETVPEKKPKPSSPAPAPAPAIPVPITPEDQITVPEKKQAPPAPVQVQPERDLQPPSPQ